VLRGGAATSLYRGLPGLEHRWVIEQKCSRVSSLDSELAASRSAEAGTCRHEQHDKGLALLCRWLAGAGSAWMGKWSCHASASCGGNRGSDQGWRRLRIRFTQVPCRVLKAVLIDFRSPDVHFASQDDRFQSS
jgi:hypothetical protein